MKKNFVVLLSILALALLWVSCASPPPVDKPEMGSQEAVDKAKAAASDAKSKAENAKAPVAAPGEYDAAMLLYSAGTSADSSGDLETALANYKDSEAAFLSAADAAEKAKEEALAAMQAADQAIADTESIAGKAIESATEGNL